MKKLIAVLFSLLIVGGAVCYTDSIDTQAINIEEASNKIKVFIGNTDNMNKSQAKKYELTQSATLKQFSQQTPDSIGSALITFNDFLSINEVTTIINSEGIITTVYIWVPEKTGRCIINVENNDLRGSIESFFLSLDLDNEPDSQYKSDMLDLMNHYGIFAIEVKDTFNHLENISNNSLLYLDLMYSMQAETLAIDKGKPLSYICIPDKPDGTN